MGYMTERLMEVRSSLVTAFNASSDEDGIVRGSVESAIGIIDGLLGNDWVCLPKDADKATIHPGDMMSNEDRSVNGVAEVGFDGHGVYVMVEDSVYRPESYAGEDGAGRYSSLAELRHWEPDTYEKAIKDLHDKLCLSIGFREGERLFESFAKRMRGLLDDSGTLKAV